MPSPIRNRLLSYARPIASEGGKTLLSVARANNATHLWIADDYNATAGTWTDRISNQVLSKNAAGTITKNTAEEVSVLSTSGSNLQAAYSYAEPHEYILFIKTTASGSFPCILDPAGNSTDAQNVLLQNGGTYNFLKASIVNTGVQYLNNKWDLIYTKINGSASIFEQDGISTPISLATAAPSGLTLFSRGNSANRWTGDIFCVVANTNGDWTNKNLAAIRDKVKLDSFSTVASYVNVIFDGDSITFGTGLQSAQRFSNVIGNGANNYKYIYNLGAPSQTLIDMNSDAATQIPANYISSAAHQLLVAFAGTNDIYFGASATTAYNRAVTYVNTIRSIYSEVELPIFFCTMLPRSNAGTPSTFESDRQSFNTLIRNDNTNFPNVIDLAANTTIGEAGDELNTTYYLDKVHPSAAGAAIIAAEIEAALNAFLA